MVQLKSLHWLGMGGHMIKERRGAGLAAMSLSIALLEKHMFCFLSSTIGGFECLENFKKQLINEIKYVMFVTKWQKRFQHNVVFVEHLCN